MRRKLLVAVTALGLGAAWACNGSYTLENPDAGSDAGDDAVAPVDAAPDIIADVETDANPEDAAVDAGSDADADAGATPVCLHVCDCDGDGYMPASCAQGGADAGDAGSDAGAFDCDDENPLVHPGQTFLNEPAVPPSNGDWDCSGSVTYQLDYNVTCSIADCTEGFRTAVACGASGSYVTCQQQTTILGMVTCSVKATTMRTQECK